MDLAEYYGADKSSRAGKMGWKGVLLNLTNTRMLYTLVVGAGGSAAAAQAGGNIKLFEAVFESMPQLYIQSIVLLGGVLKEDNTVVYVSLALSVASTAQASARAVPF